MESSHVAIKTSFEKSKNVISHKFRVALFQELRGFVSSTALNLLHDEMKNLPEGVLDAGTCGCILRRTCGLPCAHELSEYVTRRMPIPLEQIDVFWQKLDMKPLVVAEAANQAVALPDVQEWFEITAQMMGGMDDSGRKLMWRKMQEIIKPSTTSLNEPSAPIRTKGRPRKSEDKGSTKRYPSEFEYVQETIDSCSPVGNNVIYDAGPIAPQPMFRKAKRPPKAPVSKVHFLQV